MSSLDSALKERLRKLIESMGFEFVGAEFLAQGKHSVLRLYIDKVQKIAKQSVNVDECSQVSRQVRALLDVEGSLPSQYSLEVSSPGLDRPLFDLAHYEQHQGQQVKLRLRSPIEQKRNIKGVLKKVEGETIHVVLDGSTTEIAVPFSNIEKGNLIGEVSW